jgi:HSP20 family molecular chaperone IbpA
MWKVGYGIGRDLETELNEVFGGMRPLFNEAKSAVETLLGEETSENKDGWDIAIPVPGLKRSDFVLNLRGNKLSLIVNKEDVRWLSKKSWSWTVARDTKTEDISASCVDGVFTINIKKPESMNPTDQAIKIG